MQTQASFQSILGPGHLALPAALNPQPLLLFTPSCVHDPGIHPMGIWHAAGTPGTHVLRRPSHDSICSPVHRTNIQRGEVWAVSSLDSLAFNALSAPEPRDSGRPPLPQPQSPLGGQRSHLAPCLSWQE